jgi:hypothetical protein
MRVKFLASALLASCIGMCSPALAHDVHPYVCGSVGDATSNYINQYGGLLNQLKTSAGGSDLPGFTMINIDQGFQFGNNFIVFNFYGKANTTNGPFVYVQTTDGSQWAAPVSAGKVTRKITGGVSYSMSRSQFNAPGGLSIKSIIFELFPGQTADTVKISGQRVNGNTFTHFTNTLHECPVQ